jgi:hypothetical protein
MKTYGKKSILLKVFNLISRLFTTKKYVLSQAFIGFNKNRLRNILN